MNKIFLSILLVLLPTLALAADGSLTFSPPTGDYSVVFLGNIFGVVDGVLHGSGSQIMGKMFGVFNAAVLAIGGIIIMYTLMVSTLNTAQEGQFLGQKWSSIWVPVRTTFGLALLIPKASGYCLMQVFVMWIVLQGVGAADKIWNAALGYLNQGGSIIISPENPAKALISSKGSGVEAGAQTILTGQVCMLGLEKQLKNQRQSYQKQKQEQTGPCYGEIAANMKDFCSLAVPTFTSTINAVSVRNEDPESKQSSYTVPMPNFPTNSQYSSLNGICGQISWDRKDMSSDISQLASGGDNSALTKSRSIAIQQMYNGILPIAQVMVNNNPELSDSSSSETSQSNYSNVAKEQYGVPKTTSGSVCSEGETSGCPDWGASPGTKQTVLFMGTELSNAMTDYNAVMRPVITLSKEMKDKSTATNARAFITEAESSGWIMAGSYFFNLVALNQQAMVASKDAFDSDTGLDKSTYDTGVLDGLFSKNGCNTEQNYSILCEWVNKDKSVVSPISEMISGGGDVPVIGTPNPKQLSPVSSLASSTVFGYVNNAAFASQPPSDIGDNGADFAKTININFPKLSAHLPDASFDCGGIKILFVKFCIGRLLGEVFYGILKLILGVFLAMINAIIYPLIKLLIYAPLQGMALIFQHAVGVLATPGINPIVALAQMGTFYINFSGELFLAILSLSIAGAYIPVFGGLIIVILGLSAPLILAWTGVMLSIGFITAYYIPLLPYMIFTFASIAWLIAVIEAMVAAPIVALGVTHPEGHEAFGKGEPAIMILMNVFLRPSMMIIGFIAAISLSYTGVLLLNTGYSRAVGFIQTPTAPSSSESKSTTIVSFLPQSEIDANMKKAAETLAEPPIYAAGKAVVNTAVNTWDFLKDTQKTSVPIKTDIGNVTGGYTGWAGIFAYFFSVLMYTSIYLIIVQRSFTLITLLPDKVLRWIGGQPESAGQEAAQWGDEAKQKVTDSGDKTAGAEAAMNKQLQGYAQKGIASAKKAMSNTGVKATPGDGGGGE